MRLGVPVEIAPGDLVSSNIVEELPRTTAATSYNTWAAGTSYSSGDEVCFKFRPLNPYFRQFFGSGSWSFQSAQEVFALWIAKYSSLVGFEPGAVWLAQTANAFPGYNHWTLGRYADAWSATKVYPKGAVVGYVSGATGAFYQSLVDDNLGNIPSSSPSQWRQIGTTVSYTTWSGATTYAAGDQVVVQNGQVCSLFQSLQAANLNHAPLTSPTWWEHLGDSYPEWDSATTYAAEDRVIDLRTHRIYEAAQGSNLNHDPTTDTAQTWWLDAGATNRWAMFDTSTGSQTVYGETIDATVRPSELVDTVALLNMRASKAWISSRAPNASNRNLLTQTEDFTQAAWSKTNCTATADQSTDPLGDEGMDTLTATSPGGYVAQAVTFTTDGTKAHSVFLRAGTALASAVVLRDTTASADRLNVAITWPDGVPTATASAGTVVSLTDKGNDVWELRATASGVVAANTNSLRISPDTSSTGTMGVWGAQAENGSSSTPYQAVGASYSGYELVYCQYFNLADNSFITNWRRYYFDPLRYKADLLIQDLPQYTDAEIRTKVSLPGSAAKIGSAIYCWSQELGATLRDVKTGIRDYSRKETNDFGNPSFTERGFAKTAELVVAVDSANYDAVLNALAERRARPSLFIGSDEIAGLWIYGIPRDFSQGIQQYGQPRLTIQIEGLT